jgi:ABC-type sugar transport system ATPase subunit
MPAAAMLATSPDAALAMAPVIEVRGLTKEFPGVVAVDNVDLSIAPGEIVALLGQNGAGKSTLIQVLSGVHPAGTYSGEIRMSGAPFRPASVAEAEAGGVAFLAQEVNVAPDLTVAESMALNSEPGRFGFVDRPLSLARAGAALRQFDVDVDPRGQIGDLDLATQQLVLIVRALSKNTRLLILDEPTAALTERETARLFDRMRALSAKGVAIIFVSHRLAEVFEISDRIVVMRDGRIAGAFTTAETTRDGVVTEMVGTALAHGRSDRHASAARVALAAEHLTVRDETGKTLVNDLRLALHHGEIVGLFGLLGSGVVEAAMALFGAWRGPVDGTISLDGRPVAIAAPADAVRLGIGLIAQDRRDGLSGEHSIYDNTILASLDAFSGRFGFVDAMAARRQTLDLFDRLKIKASSIDTTVGTLSGGNQQKVQVARWLAAGVKVLLLVDPTRGVDVGARGEIDRIWAELAAAGCALLIVSSDAEELVAIADRVVVLRNGHIAGEVAKDDLSESRLLRLAAGV